MIPCRFFSNLFATLQLVLYSTLVVVCLDPLYHTSLPRDQDLNLEA